MAKKEKGKGFFAEFKKFITRGNVLDMAVGVIVGGAFTAIVNAISNSVLKPIINYLLALVFGKNGLSEIIWYLKKVETVDATTQATVVDLANSIYIDWGAVVTAIINFLLIAFVLFIIVRMINKVADARKDAIAGLELGKKKEIAKIRREEKVSKKQAIAIYEERVAAAKAKAEEEARIAEEKAAEEARLAEEKAMANTVLLAEIRDLLKNK